MRHIDRPSPRPQLIVFNLFGDYVLQAGGAAWTTGLLEVLGLLEIGARAARTTLSRMKRRGWLEARRVGRRSLYRATPKARALLLEGGERLFGPRPGPWDGSWHLIAYSLPVARRLTRHRLRTRLSWLGYGTVQPGTLIAAYPRSDEVENLVRELEVAPYIHEFRHARLDPQEQERIVRSCWDLTDIDSRYAAFMGRYKPALSRLRQRQARGAVLDPDECFAWRFWATYDYSEFPRVDPLLPDELLPRGWRGHQAYALLTELRQRTREPAWEYLRSTGLLAPAALDARTIRRATSARPGAAKPSGEVSARRRRVKEPGDGR